MLVTMMMNTMIPASLSSSKSTTVVNRKPARARAIRCIRKNEEISSLFNDNQEMKFEGVDITKETRESFQSSNVERGSKHKDIWRLFKEAQQNILYLNKQRLLAVEQLNKLKNEKQVLLGNVGQMKMGNREENAKDKLSSVWELLLRVDSMVLNGLINTEEASGLRELVTKYRLGIADMFHDILKKGDAEILAELRVFSDKIKRNGFHIIHICTEMEPLVSTGPLASYITGLSLALQKKGHLVEVILPKYASLELDEVQGLREVEAEAYSYFNGQLCGNKIWTGVVCGIGVTFIEPLYYSSFFNREKVYGYSDDFERFSYFSRASLDYIVKSGKRPDVLHIHNWQTAIVGPLFWDIFVTKGLEGARVLLTCQSFDSQCLEQPDKLALCGLDPARLNRPDRLQDNANTHSVNILKGGIVYSNKVLVISSIDPQGKNFSGLSHGLEPTLAHHKEKLRLTSLGFDNSVEDAADKKILDEDCCDAHVYAYTSIQSL